MSKVTNISTNGNSKGTVTFTYNGATYQVPATAVGDINAQLSLNVKTAAGLVASGQATQVQYIKQFPWTSAIPAGT